jgi:hypothetical protein
MRPSPNRRLAATLAAILAAAVFSAAAQTGARPRPAGTVPLDEPPPPPAMVDADPALQPQVTTRTEGEQTIQEYRIGGKLYMQRVTPKHGKPYVLMDNKGDGTFTRQDHTLDSGVRVPQWVLLEF